MKKIERRKSDHIDVTLNENVVSDYDYWADVHFVHQALPEVNMDDIDTSVTLFGKRLEFPLVVTAITGGFPLAEKINRNLAEACAKMQIGFGVGSQRPAIEHGDDGTYSLIKEYDVPLVIGNVGAPQLVRQKNKGPFSLEDVLRARELIDADIMAIHLNFLQEVIQPEGDVNALGCLEGIRSLAKELPCMVKETGAGISRETALQLKGTGIRGMDVSGMGGTNFAVVEMHRARMQHDLVASGVGATFFEWGIPAPAAVIEADVGLEIIASGGVDNGLRMAKGIALGGNAAGCARILLAEAMDSTQSVIAKLEMMKAEFKAAMFLTGCSEVADLRRRRIIVSGRTADWLSAAED
ncbi:MAG TPA: type 2 isopentenyl-diphosphate Delta-isomerase [Methanomassiliicoccales archaeon]|nr:type 2 isopentenyl-diphosphate Delta-isomerase [Methanomassiliicoccales archaeon]